MVVIAFPALELQNQVKDSPTLTQFDAGQSLTDIQLTAIDLYERGFNVLPLKYGEKKPYLLKPFFTSRLHHCSILCHHKGHDDISELFKRKNIGVMMGRTSGNLLAIDCDSHVSFEKIGKELTARKLPFWAITGNRGGAYLLRVIEGEAGNLPKGKSKFTDVEIWGNRHQVVIPPSVHPSGIVYQWATPEPRYHLSKGETLAAVSITSLDWLGVMLDLEARNQWEDPELHGLAAIFSPLSRPNRETYTVELSEGERNNRIFAFACDAKAHGIDYHQTETVVLEIAKRCDLPAREAIATLKSAYSQDRTPAHNGGGVREWQQAQAFAQAFDWRGTFGRKALKRQAVYMACIERARCEGRSHWRATVREVAELANVNKETANESLLDLIKAGLLKPVTESVYRFMRLSEFRTLYTTGSCSVRTTDTPKSQGEQDVFGKLGLVSWHVWRYLLKHSGGNISQIARETGLPRSSVSEALKTLTHHNVRLVSLAEGTYYGEPRTESSLQSMALFWTDGGSQSKARKEGHKLERERRVNWLIRQAVNRKSV
jgi:predicted transcriptional regulator